MRIIRWLLASLFVWTAILSPRQASAQGLAQGFGVGNYEVLSSTRVGRTTFDFVMRATITNNSLPALGVVARATSNSTNTTLISRTLYFGDVSAGASAVSTNTFTIRQNRLVPFDPSSLQWAVSVQVMSLSITLDSPATGFLTNGTNVVVSGTVGTNVTAVQVNGVAATLSGSNYTATVPLIEGKNTLSAVAQNVFGGSGVASVQVSRDTLPPIITIGSPATGAVVSASQIIVSGNVNDIASGTTVNGNQILVTVNGITATVANRSYVVPEILLTRGKNKITARAVDQAGNEGIAETEVVYQEPVAQKRLVMVGGNNQSGTIATTLPEPLLVALLDANGAALTNQPVTFAVTQNDGMVLAAPNSGTELTVQTDDKGLASVLFRLGLRTGAGNNQITVKSPGVVGEVIFSESSLVGDPVRISALLPETQVGETGKRLPAPWFVFVTDAGGNPVAETPVTFTVSQGAGGMVDGAQQVTRLTDRDGKASVIHTLGSEDGINNNVVMAQLSTFTNSLVLFKASAMAAQRPEDTRVVGLVLDNANQPMPNVFCGITGTRLITVTDQHGQFVISNAPVGAVRLFVDARDRGYPGTWHVLEFDLITVAGRANSVDRPIYMLSMDEAGSAMAGGDKDVTLQMKGIPGATMTILAHSVRDAAGNPVTERVMFTQVNAERLPMPPPRGSQFMLAWTVQPAGLRFNPPAKMCIPNTGLPPGQVIELFSFDHDLVQFAAIGTARVTADGSQICSDPGFGVIKSGWGGGAPPPPPPCSAACGPPPVDTECVQHEAIPPTTPCGCPSYRELNTNHVEITSVDAKAEGVVDYITSTNQPVKFTVATVQNKCPGLDYEWAFGDGSTSNIKDPTNTYTAGGEFTVKVVATCTNCPNVHKESPPVKVTVVTVKSLIVSDAANPVNVRTNEPDKDLIIASTNTAQVSFSVVIDPDTPATRSKVLWKVDGNTAAPSSGNFSGAANTTLTINGGNRSFAIKAGIDSNNDGTLQDGEAARVVNVHLADVTFSKNTLQSYGFDSVTNSPDQYLSVNKDGFTRVNVSVSPFVADGYWVTSSDTSKFDVPGGGLKVTTATAPILVTASSALFDTAGHNSALLEVRASSVTGPILKTLNVELYRKNTIEKVTYYRILDSNVPATTPAKNPTLSDLKTAMNSAYQQAVMEVTIVDGSTAQNIHYDLNGNGILDYVNNDTSPEVDVIKNAGLAGDPKIAYVEKIRDNWKLAVAAPAGTNRVVLANASGTDVGNYNIGPAIGAGEAVTVTAKAGNILTLSAPLATAHPATDTFYGSLAGLSTDPQLVTDAAGELLITIPHEMMHRDPLGNLSDLAESDNIMYYTTGSTGKNLRFRDQTIVNTGTGTPTGATEKQWNKITRPLF